MSDEALIEELVWAIRRDATEERHYDYKAAARAILPIIQRRENEARSKGYSSAIDVAAWRVSSFPIYGQEMANAIRALKVEAIVGDKTND